MTDIELTRAAERGQIPSENFPHRAHLSVAWVYLSESDSVDQAGGKMRETLQRFAAAAGKPEKYHETVTLFWVRLLGHLRAASAGAGLSEILQRHPELLKKEFPLTYYSSGRLFSDEARKTWIEPDLKPLPTNGASLCSSSSSRNTPDWALS